MADSIGPNSDSDQSSLWTEERTGRLTELWAQGLTAAEIAREIGIRRNAVIGKAHTLGLESRALADALTPDPKDPIISLGRSSVSSLDILDWFWPDSETPYLASPFDAIFEVAADIISAHDSEQAVVIQAAEFIDAALAFALEGSSPSSIGSLLKSYEIMPSPRAMDAVRAYRAAPPGLPAVRPIIGWEIVDILRAAASIRRRVDRKPSAINLSHLFVALLLTPSGQAGLRSLDQLTRGIDPFRQLALAIADELARTKKSPYREPWESVRGGLEAIREFAPSRFDRAGYSSDRVRAGQDVFGASVDARALADIILLRAAEPPLAIGVFGPWGSGKSTLLAELKTEIREQALAERAALANGVSASDEIARVSGVLQLEFNAWTFADSANLWASMTAELFDQIAAGGIENAETHGGRHGAELVNIVANRTAKELELLRAATGYTAVQEEKIAESRRLIAVAESSAKLSLIGAAADTAQALLGPERKPDDKDKFAAKANSPEETALEIVRSGVLAGEKPEERIRRYAEASTSIARWFYASRDYLRGGTSWMRRTLISASVVVTIATVYVLVFGSPVALPSHGQLALILIAVVGWVASILSFGLPALRVVSLFHAKMLERRRQAREDLAKAKEALSAGERELAASKSQADKSKAFVDHYRRVAEGGSPAPALLLDFLLRESTDVATVRANLGLLSTVRKCFEQLNSVISAMREKREADLIERIIIYIDDLDRCPEKQVVEVLEAVHLLLAFPCFVVVVAVDPQWLKLSLEKQYDQLSRLSGPSAADYLEKIFQIPFWIRPIRGRSDDPAATGRYRRYVRDLLGQAAIDAQDFNPLAENENPHVRTISGFRPLPPEAPEVEPAVARSRLRLDAIEIVFFEAMAPLAAKSPRAVKRMANLYRLIRAGLTDDRRRTFLDAKRRDRAPTYATVQFALACEVGLPQATVEAIAAALPLAKPDDWGDILTACSTEHILSPDSSLAPLLAALRDGNAVEPFTEALTAFFMIGSGIPPIEQLVTSFELVGRYSFRSCFG
ncbi:hypothetical protein E2493_13640 [Sphingomonas parva]|uniref:KAP NTPase domain-containing protein n=1 Tax=Sphingomonas parva TaxID=2555898 RepID=A0A4Y8ZQE2_9SPHN|nr:P-loop NTPase fold protein [Sphingomonas parva]TFI57687.1 hypothetical protein E2493_13640 [Sphingomonas parva]